MQKQPGQHVEEFTRSLSLSPSRMGPTEMHSRQRSLKGQTRDKVEW